MCEFFCYENVGKFVLVVVGLGFVYWKGLIEGMVVVNGGIVNVLMGVEVGVLGGE